MFNKVALTHIRPGFRDNLARLAHAQKPGGGVPAYMRWVNRGAARSIAAASAVVGLTPNGVTAISAVFTAMGLTVLVVAPMMWGTGVVVAILLALGFAFDSADGQLARLTGVSSPAGEWLDHVVDAIRTPTVHLCVAAAVIIHHPEWMWAVAIAACFAVLGTGQFTSQLLAEQLVRQRGGEPPRAERCSQIIHAVAHRYWGTVLGISALGVSPHLWGVLRTTLPPQPCAYWRINGAQVSQT